MGHTFPAGVRKGGSHSGKTVPSRAEEMARFWFELKAQRRYARKHPKAKELPP